MQRKRIPLLSSLGLGVMLGSISTAIAAATAAAPAPITLACPFNNGSLGVLYSSSLTAGGGVPPYNFSLTKGALPAGVTLNATSGALSGTPTAAGASTFTAKVVDSLVVGAGGSPNTTTVTCTITVDNCAYTIAGPPDVPGLAQYTYQITLPAGKMATGITWSVDKPTASISGATDQVQALIQFKNSKPDWVSVKANFTLTGAGACAVKPVALVMVTVGAAAFTNPGSPKALSPADRKSFLVNPPAAPAVPTWVTTNTPGSDWRKFTYNGTSQAGEPRKKVTSDSGADPAFKAESKVTLTSPAEKNTAQQKIQVGFIQGYSDSGSSNYAGDIKRTVTVPTNTAVDWMSGITPGATDEWPWYDQSVRATGAGTGTWSTTFKMTDSPALSIPAEYNPNDAADANKNKALATAAETEPFPFRLGARTLDSDLGADTHYFDESDSKWTVNYAWPVVAGASIVTLGGAWTTPGAPTEIPVNVVSASIVGNGPFLRWNPATCKPAVCP